MSPLEVLETCLYVDDLAAAERFYAEVLQLEVVGRQQDRHVFLRCGAGMLLLFDPSASALESEIPGHGAQGVGHLAFRAPQGELQLWRERLASHGVAIERVIDWPQGGQSIYFRDPAGNSLELASPQIWASQETGG